MSLTERQKKQLRRLGHERKALVIIGSKGLTDTVLAEIDRALHDHELVKVRVNAEDRAARDRLIETICSSSAAQAVQQVGHIALLYRARPEKPRIVLA